MVLERQLGEPVSVPCYGDVRQATRKASPLKERSLGTGEPAVCQSWQHLCLCYDLPWGHLGPGAMCTRLCTPSAASGMAAAPCTAADACHTEAAPISITSARLAQACHACARQHTAAVGCCVPNSGCAWCTCSSEEARGLHTQFCL